MLSASSLVGILTQMAPRRRGSVDDQRRPGFVVYASDAVLRVRFDSACSDGRYVLTVGACVLAARLDGHAEDMALASAAVANCPLGR